jgi:signal transduction histidine kinase
MSHGRTVPDRLAAGLRDGNVAAVATRVLMPTERVTLIALAIGRWAAWAWMVGVVAFSGDALVRPWLAFAACAAGAGFAALATYGLRVDTALLFRPEVLIAESLFVVSLHLVDGAAYAPGHVFAVSQNLAVEWPLLVVLSVAVIAGPSRAAMLGLAAGATKWGGAILNDFDGFSTKHVVSVFSTCVQLAVAGLLGGRIAGRLRRVETEVAAQRARDDVARTLHDTVLQTLAVVSRRLAGSDPEMAGMVRSADRDLRAYLAGGVRQTDDLRTRIFDGITRVQARLDPSTSVRCVVNAMVDGHSLSPTQQDALVGAITEAVANALEHAQASEVVVFVEADDDGHVFASVRDDGNGFERAAGARAGSIGIAQSIEGRMRDAGGRAVVDSRRGRGTEVNLWTAP